MNDSGAIKFYIALTILKEMMEHWEPDRNLWYDHDGYVELNKRRVGAANNWVLGISKAKNPRMTDKRHDEFSTLALRGNIANWSRAEESDYKRLHKGLMEFRQEHYPRENGIRVTAIHEIRKALHMLQSVDWNAGNAAVLNNSWNDAVSYSNSTSSMTIEVHNDTDNVITEYSTVNFPSTALKFANDCFFAIGATLSRAGLQTVYSGTVEDVAFSMGWRLPITVDTESYMLPSSGGAGEGFMAIIRPVSQYNAVAELWFTEVNPPVFVCEVRDTTPLGGRGSFSQNSPAEILNSSALRMMKKWRVNTVQNTASKL